MPTPCYHMPHHSGASTLVLPQDVFVPSHPVTFLSLCPSLWSVMIPTLLSLWGQSCLWSLHLHSPGDLSHLSVGVSGSDSLCFPWSPHPLFPPAPQMALRNCSAVADTHCGCRPGWFMDCMVSQCRHGSPFRCRPCTDCGALHRHTQTPCEYPHFGLPHPTPSRLLLSHPDPQHLQDHRF